MSQNLSTHGFKWMTPEEVKKWNDVPHYVEVDIEYHQEWHELNDQYSLDPQHTEVGPN